MQSDNPGNTIPISGARFIKRRKRGHLRQVILVTIVVLTLMFCRGAIQRTIAMAQGIVSPMPLAYAYAPSPNADDRPVTATINCVVLHATVEPTTEGTIGLFLNPATKVSSHFIVGKDGRVFQMVPIEKRAWHAGVSSLDGVNKVNDFSVGIEMVNANDGADPYPLAQMESVAGLIRFIRSRYPVPDERIVSHASVALPAGRKSDPIGFDFEKVKILARLGTIEHTALSGVPTAP